MTRVIVVIGFVVALGMVVGCQEEAKLAPPKIFAGSTEAVIFQQSTNLEFQNKCPRRVTIGIRNQGDQPLEIKSVKTRGDQNCAFAPWELEQDPSTGKEKKELQGGEEAFLSALYVPTTTVGDSIAVIIRSNDTDHPTYEVPICGVGVVEEVPANCVDYQPILDTETGTLTDEGTDTSTEASTDTALPATDAPVDAGDSTDTGGEAPICNPPPKTQPDCALQASTDTNL